MSYADHRQRLLSIPSDIVKALSKFAKDNVEDIRQRAERVGDTLDSSVSALDAKDYVSAGEAGQIGVDATSNSIDAALESEEKKSTYDEHASTWAWQSELADRTASLVEELSRDDRTYEASLNFLMLMEKYLNVVKKFKDDTSVSHQSEKKAAKQDKPSHSSATSIVSDTFAAELSVSFSYHLLQMFRAGREILEGLSGGKDFSSVLQTLYELQGAIARDSELEVWVADSINLLMQAFKRFKENSKDPTGCSTLNKSLSRDLQRMEERLSALLKRKPRIRELMSDCREYLQLYILSVKSQPLNRKIAARTRHILAMMKDVLKQGAESVETQASNAFSTFFHAILPSLGNVLGAIPLPRVEFTSDQLDAVVEDVHISALQLIPEHFKLTTTNTWSWGIPHEPRPGRSLVETNVRIGLGGLRLAVSDISFYVQERYTAPSAGACLGCCSFGGKDSESCFLRGPSSWFAYTESAILDVGFQKSGVSMILDVEHTGQQKESSNKHQNLLQMDHVQTQNCEDLDEEDEGNFNDEQRRRTFFQINECKVNIDDSFDFNLRNSRHWIFNKIVRWTMRPILKVLLSRIMSAQVRHAFTKLDEKLWDTYRRAKYVHRRRQLESMRGNDSNPGWSDYLVVLVNNNAGKSKARLAHEAKKKLQQDREQRNDCQDQQPSQTQPMEIRPSSVVMHDSQGSYSIAVGLPSSGLLDKHGPPTTRTRIRDMATNPRDTLETFGSHGEHIYQATRQSLAESDPLLPPTHNHEEDTSPSVTRKSPIIWHHPGDAEWGWKCDAFEIR